MAKRLGLVRYRRYHLAKCNLVGIPTITRIWYFPFFYQVVKPKLLVTALLGCLYTCFPKRLAHSRVLSSSQLFLRKKQFIHLMA